MSKEFLLNPNDTDVVSANDYEKITKFDAAFIYYSSDNTKHKFGYCTHCGLKVFWTKPKKENGDHFFRHVSGFYTEVEQIRMLSCDNYKPSKGITGNPKPLPPSYLGEIISFIKDNSFWIYKYINKYVLNDIAYLNEKYYVSLIESIFINNVKSLSTVDMITERMIPYNILALINTTGNIDFKKINNSTINFKRFSDNKKDKYYDYVHFSLRKEFLEEKILGLEVINSIDFHKNAIIPPNTLYTKKIPIHINKLFEYIKHEKKYEHKFKMSNEQILNSKFKFKESIIKEKKLYDYIVYEIENLKIS